MTTTIKLEGVPQAMRAFRELPRRVGIKHLRIALNAGASPIRARAASLARRETGLLSKSLGIKVKIPDASYNSAHHGKPAYAVIGPKRKAGRFMRINKQGNLKGFGAAQRELVATRKRLAGTLTPLAREREASRQVAAKFGAAVFRVPSRYAHLVERKTSFINAAARQESANAVAKISQKLTQGIETERASLVGG